MCLVKLIERKKSSKFNSIENVFDTLIPFLNINEILELPFLSKGVFNRIKNIAFLRRHNAQLIHISGHDHYLLWYPFPKAILTIHDIEALKRKKGIKRWLFQKLWFDWPIRNAKVVTTISEFSKKEIQSISNYKTPIQVIHNPLTLPLTYVPKSFDKVKPRILHIGTKENKNLSRLIQSLKGTSCKIVVVGQETESLKSQMEACGLDYTFKQNLSKDSMMTEYQLADILAFVSTYEGFGLPILEAQAVGRVVLTSNVSSMPEVAGKGALSVDPFSVEAIRKGVEKLIKEDSLREILIQNGLENIKRFDTESIAGKYNDLYSSVLAT